MPSIEIELSEETVAACEDRIEGTEFASVEEYVSFVVGEIVADGEDNSDTSEREVDRDQLEALGYL